jgi:cytochrome c biogenesis protein CcmG/thiol:disulfide interchange protein DsbE
MTTTSLASAIGRSGAGSACWAVALGLALLLLAGCGQEAPKLRNGDPAPAFDLERLSGGRIALPDDLAGQVVAVRFWADWCPYCKDEMTELEPVYERLAERGLRIVAVNVAQDRKTAERFVRRIAISYDVALDPEAEVANAYGVIGLPTTFFVDRDGTVHGKILGESDAAVFVRMVEGLL